MTRLISIVLPTYNRLPRLQKVIRALEGQTLPTEQFEVIVVSDGSTDQTNSFLESYAGPLHLRPILKENGGVATARNAGFEAAQCDLILFIDDDVIPQPDLIERHLARHQQHGPHVVVIGPMLTPAAADFNMPPWVKWEQAMLEKQYKAMSDGAWEPSARQFYTGNTSLARQLLVEEGGFDPSFRRAEDVELAYRLAQRGIRFVFAAEAIGYHFAERSFASWLNIPYVYGRNDVIFSRDKAQTWLLPTIYKEFKERNWLIQQLVKGVLDRPAAQKAMIEAAEKVVPLLHNLRLQRLSRLAYSAIFNVRYYQGVADEMGGKAVLMAKPAVEALVPAAAKEPLNPTA